MNRSEGLEIAFSGITLTSPVAELVLGAGVIVLVSAFATLDPV